MHKINYQKMCYKKCGDCTKPYQVSAQRYCYDLKLGYLHKNPLIVRKEQKLMPGRVNKLAESYEDLIESAKKEDGYVGWEQQMYFFREGNIKVSDYLSPENNYIEDEDKLYIWVLDNIVDNVLEKRGKTI